MYKKGYGDNNCVAGQLSVFRLYTLPSQGFEAKFG